MKRIISLLIVLLIGALASWITPKAPVTPQNAGFEAITAEVEEHEKIGVRAALARSFSRTLTVKSRTWGIAS